MRNRSERFLHNISIFRRILFLSFLLFSIFFLFACNFDREESKGCTPPSREFSEADLVGVWVARRYSYPRVSDTVIIKDDGTYKQIIEKDAPPVYYESEWQSWRIDYSESGLPYLHMEGMRLCAYVPDIFDCNTSGGGDYYWYDFCKNETTQMPVGEAILMVTRTNSNSEESKQGIILTLLSAHPEDSSWRYELEKGK